MALVTPELLSGSTNGQPIAIAATSGTGTLIHTAAANSGTSQFDECWLWACNIDTTTHTLTLQWGTTATSGEIIFSIPSKTVLVVASGWRLNNGLTVRAIADTANMINVTGNVNNIA